MAAMRREQRAQLAGIAEPGIFERGSSFTTACRGDPHDKNSATYLILLAHQPSRVLLGASAVQVAVVEVVCIC